MANHTAPSEDTQMLRAFNFDATYVASGQQRRVAGLRVEEPERVEIASFGRHAPIEERLIHRVTAKVWGLYLTPDTRTASTVVKFDAPATWWQMWKEQHAHWPGMRWALRRWPVRTVVHTKLVAVALDVQRAALFPDFDAETRPYLPLLGPAAPWHQTGRETWTVEEDR